MASARSLSSVPAKLAELEGYKERQTSLVENGEREHLRCEKSSLNQKILKMLIVNYK